MPPDESLHRVLGIAGSPRRGGNSERLLDRALEGVAEAEPGAAIFSEMPNLSPNAAGQGFYADTQLAKKADALYGATGFTPDLGDAITGFGEAEWAAIIAVVQGGDIQTALDAAAAVQAEVLGQ